MAHFIKKTKSTLMGLLAALLCLSLLLTSCSKDPEKPEGNESDTVVTYTVTFDSQGGTAVPTEQVPEGGRANAPTPPTLENRVFKGWLYNGVLWDFSKKVTSDMHLVASWEDATQMFEYTVSNGFATVTGIKNTTETAVIIPATIAGFPVGAIGEGAFDSVSNGAVTSITLPATVHTIGAYAFQGCAGIPINLSGAVITSLGENAFEECDGLGSIVLGEGLTEIPASAFLKCTALTSVMLPTTLTRIDESAFEGCDGLSSLLIHKGVTEIGHSAFRDCDHLITLLFGGNAEELDAMLDRVEPTMNEALLELAESACLYSEVEPTEEGSFWHYDENRMPKIWLQ